MDAPPVHYVKTSDGVSIAYAVMGQGTPLIWLPETIDHVQLGWQVAWRRPWLERMAERFRLIRYDCRGQGLSSRGLDASAHTLEGYRRDLEAVVQRLQLDQYILFGRVHFCDTAVRHAVAHPDKVLALILAAGSVRGADWKTSALDMLAEENWELLLSSFVRVMPADEGKATLDALRGSIDQEDYVHETRALKSFDLTDVLPRLRTPLLVLQPRSMLLLPMECGQRLAQLGNGRFMALDGLPVLGDVDQGMRAIEAFLAELAQVQPATSAAIEVLSQREIEVLRLIATGKSNQQIADELVISINTANRHVSNIYAKTGVENRAQAVGYAHRQGLV